MSDLSSPFIDVGFQFDDRLGNLMIERCALSKPAMCLAFFPQSNEEGSYVCASSASPAIWF